VPDSRARPAGDDATARGDRRAAERSAARSVAGALAMAVLFALAVGAGGLVHLNVPAVRRAIVARVNGALGSAFAGRIVVERLERLGPSRLEGLAARIEDPDGRTALRVEGVKVHVDLAPLLRSLVSGRDLAVTLDELAIPTADVALDANDAGELGLARAFGPRGPPAPSAPASRGLMLDIPHAVLGHASVHGQPSPGLSVDGSVDGADAAVRISPGSMELGVAHAHVTARGLPPGLTMQGVLDARLAQPAPDGTDRFAHATWRGTLGELAATADLRYDAGQVDAVVDVPAARPECVRGLWAECPFRAAASAHAEVHGALPHLLASAHAAVGPGVVVAAGPVTVGDGVRASVNLVATGVDANAITGSGPTTELDAHGTAVLTAAKDGEAGAAAVVDLVKGTVGTTPLPPVTLRGRVLRDAAGKLHVDSDVAVHESGAPVTASLHLYPRGDSFEAAFDASVDVPRLDRVPRMGARAAGTVRARTHGTVDLGTHAVDAEVEASASLHAGEASVGGASLTAHVTGPWDAPRVDADAWLHDLAAGSLEVDQVRAQVHGPPGAAKVALALQGHDADVDARAELALNGGTALLRDVLVDLRRHGESARATAAAVRVAGSQATVESLEVDGLGAPLHATVRAAPGSVVVVARSRGLDLARLGRLAGVAGLGGRLALDVDSSAHARGARGRIVLDLSQGSYATWTGASAHVDAALDDRHASGHVTASLEGLGSLDVRSSSLEIGPAGPLVPSSWRTAWGAIDAHGHVDLARLAQRLPKGTLPVAVAAGGLDLDARLARDSPADTSPDVDIAARTEDLVVAAPPASWHIDGLGLTAHARVDGRSGVTSVDVQVADKTGPLVALASSSNDVPYALIFSAAEPLGDALRAMPFQATLTVPSRDVATLPAIVETGGLQGSLQATVEWAGAALKPTIDLHAALTHARADPRVFAFPLDVDLGAHYDGARAAAKVRAVLRERPVLVAEADVQAPAEEVFAGELTQWTGSLRSTLSELPLQAFGPLDEKQVRGRVSGTISLDGLHKDARAVAALSFDQMEVGDVVCLPSSVDVRVDGHAASASARIVEQDGDAQVTARLGARWGAALIPSVDPGQPSDISLSARHFRIAALLPFVSKVMSELDGRIDGGMAVHVDPAAKSVQPQGTIALEGGRFEVNALGTELHDATARIVATPDGIVRLEQARARGLSGRIDAAATARFRGTEFAGARAVVSMPRKDPLPLVADGTPVGLIDGHFDIAVDRTANQTDIAVDVPTMRLQLPNGATHDVQALGGLPGVRTGIATGPSGAFVPVDLDAHDADTEAVGAPRSPVRLTVRLGKEVQVKRADLDVHLEGGPVITIGERTVATGQIRLLRGSLDVKGKKFTIDHGTVTFVDDPSNPQLVVGASWSAPDNTTVIADFVGPLKTAKLTLHSEPARSKDEILALILYGTTDTASGASTGSPQLNAAQGVAGSAASEKVNEALGGVNHALESMGLAGSIATKIDTSQATPRPEVEFQIGRDLSLQLAAVLGIPPPGTNPDKYLLTIGWRFLRQWSLETTVGDQGTSILDVVWQHRY
jgi:translocation and assembly module TamB